MLNWYVWAIACVTYYLARRFSLGTRLLACAGATLPVSMLANVLDEREASRHGLMLSGSGQASTYLAGAVCGVICGLVFFGIGKLFGWGWAKSRRSSAENEAMP